MAGKKCIKPLIFIFMFLLFIFGSMTVCADMMFDNSMDDFYNKNVDKCENVRLNYTANGAKGYIIGWESPVSGKKVAELINGSQFTVESLYTDDNGVKWGLACEYEYRGTEQNVIFWMKISDLKKGYTTDVITPVNPPYLWFTIENNAVLFLIALAPIVTIVLIRVLWKKQKETIII